jgi:hypothetical protein
VWDWRGTDFWIVWYFFFLIFFDTVVPLAIFLGARALYAEAWAERAPAMMASAAAPAAPAASVPGAPPPSGTGTPA